MMRVVHLIKVTGIAGAENHLLTLLAGLRAKTIDARLLLLVEPDNLVEAYVQALQAREIPVQREIIRHHLDLSLYWRLRRLLRQHRPHIVHTHLWHADLFGIPAARLAGVKTVISSRHNDDSFRRKMLIRWTNRALWGMTSAGIAISDAIRQFSIAVEGVNPAKIHTIRYGLPHTSGMVDQRAARQTLRETIGAQDDAPLVGLVCRLTEQKGVQYALEAFAQIAAEFPAARLVIAGDGPLREKLQHTSKTLNIDQRVHFLGWRDDAAQVLAALDVFLMPSLWEGFGLVMLEAMAQQLPIIGSRVSAVPEVVQDGETGLLVPARDSAALANALRTLLQDKPLRRHMGLLGEDRLETHFSAARLVDETAALYQRLSR